MPTFAQVSRLSLKNILFPTDFSPASRAALPFAQKLAQTYGSTILLVHAIAPPAHPMVVTDRIPPQDDLDWQEARHNLDEFGHDAALRDCPWKAVVDRGDLSEVIPDLVGKKDVDLIVLGTHGRRGIAKLVLGSSAEKIYRSATCPVLTVGPRAHEAAKWGVRRILCPIDVAEDPEPVLRYALSLAEEHQAEFILLEAVPMVPWQHRASVEERSRRVLEELVPDEARNWCVPQFLIRWEHPAEAILRAAEERDADLIVMSVHRSRASTWSSHLPWPVASEVVSRASCPVLTVRV